MTARGTVFAPTIIVTALALTAAPALGASTRAEYVAQVDPICHQANVDTRAAFRKHHLKSVIELGELQSDDRKAQLRVATGLAIIGRFGTPAADQIATVPPPPGDEILVSTWLAWQRTLFQNFERAAHAIRKNKPNRAYRLVIRSLRPLDPVSEQLASFGFQHCV